MQRGGGRRERGDRGRGRARRVGEQRGERHRHHRRFDEPPLPDGQLGPRGSRDRRDDAPADDDDEEHEQSGGEVDAAQRPVGVALPDPQVKERVERGEHAERDGQEDAVPIFRADQRANERIGDRRQQCDVDRGRGPAGPGPHQHAAGQPQQPQRGERRALRGIRRRPGAQRRQQEAGHDRAAEAEHHFVRVPEQAARGGRASGRIVARERAEPREHRDRAEAGAAEIEGPEAGRP
ncbi:hypothetical protein DP49_6460 [Burkholderia pseudomallei]|nr:hypothetical protein DP49_6460 [Burkholderia pseudomallei]